MHVPFVSLFHHALRGVRSDGGDRLSFLLPHTLVPMFIKTATTTFINHICIRKKWLSMVRLTHAQNSSPSFLGPLLSHHTYNLCEKRYFHLYAQTCTEAFALLSSKCNYWTNSTVSASYFTRRQYTLHSVHQNE